MRKIELLSPAKDAEIGIEAFNHGADAVYIGASRYSARANAGNDIRDIERMASYGHRYGAKTYVALNTILRDEELLEAESFAWKLYEAGVDALIIQDYGLLKMNLPPIELHASTQMDNRTPDKVALLKQLGFQRVVLARELSLHQISEISRSVDVELECFVHGALCVSVSGQCYLSAAMTGRSANRGVCAQPCRLPMDLEDAKGNVLLKQKHLLSLKDMNRSSALKSMIEAGITSFKIEGRLKDMSYVKNVTAYYRQKLDHILTEMPECKSLSQGICHYNFIPRLEASFNRGFTTYFINGGRETVEGKNEIIWDMDFPKSVGEYIGIVNKVGNGWFSIALRSELLNNGDGIVIKDKNGKNFGFRLNKNDLSLKRLYPANPCEVLPNIHIGSQLYRNLDYRFDQLLQKKSASRKIPIKVYLYIFQEQLQLHLIDDYGVRAQTYRSWTAEKARTSQKDNILKQLQKFGDTIFQPTQIELVVSDCKDYFIPSSLLSDLRREASALLEENRKLFFDEERNRFTMPEYLTLAKKSDAREIIPKTYLANVINSSAKSFLQDMKIDSVDQAFEDARLTNVPVMFTKHCIKYALGCCPKYQQSNRRLEEPLKLKIGDKKFVIKFGCQNDCMSEIFITFASQTN